MAQIDFETLAAHAKSLAGLTPEREALLVGMRPAIAPALPGITEAFYTALGTIPATAPFLEGRLELLKQTHLRWLNELFTGPFDIAYTQAMHRVGHVHVRVGLPVEFMAGGTSLIADRLIAEINTIYQDDDGPRLEALGAVNAILGFSLIVMQQSYHRSMLHEELEKFLKITGMSRKLFNNLVAASSK